MAICTQCGSIMHEADVLKHVCKKTIVKGIELIPTTSESVIL